MKTVVITDPSTGRRINTGQSRGRSDLDRGPNGAQMKLPAPKLYTVPDETGMGRYHTVKTGNADADAYYHRKRNEAVMAYNKAAADWRKLKEPPKKLQGFVNAPLESSRPPGYYGEPASGSPATPPWQQHIPGTGGIKPTREAVAAWEQQHGPGSAWGNNTQAPVNATSPATPATPTAAPTTSSFAGTRPDYRRARRRKRSLDSLRSV